MSDLPSTIQGLVAFGWAQAGQVLGPAHAHYRPAGPGPALAPANQLGTLPFVASATPDGALKRPATLTQVEWFGLFDTGQTRAGDYLTGPDGTWFVAEQGLLSAPVVVRCNATLDASRTADPVAGQGTAPDPGASQGLQGYGGAAAYSGPTKGNQTVLFTAWPALLLIGGRAENSRAGLPGDVREGGMEAYLPRVPGPVLQVGDHIGDDLGRRLSVSAVQLTPRGYRLRLVLDQT